jgi:predicted patatin/cPLA2 family phospholipase
MEKYFFEIPIFRCTQSQHITEIESQIKKISEYFRSANDNLEYDYDKLARKGFKYPGYRYSEMVGMIRLFYIPGQIRGELYFINQRISKNLKNKTWTQKGKAFEIWLREGDTNQTIYKRILERLNSYKKESKKLSKCYVDKTCFENIGGQIDFLSMQ